MSKSSKWLSALVVALPLSASLPSAAALGAPIRFKDEAAARGVQDLAVNATGPTFGDYDGDGDLDVFVPVEDLAPGLHDRLFENDGKGIFRDVAAERGVQNPGSFSRAPRSIRTSWNGRTSRSGWITGWRMASAGPSALPIGRSSSEMQSQRSR